VVTPRGSAALAVFAALALASPTPTEVARRPLTLRN